MLATEAENRELLVMIVGLDDAAHHAHRSNVLVLRAQGVQGARLGWLTVGGSVIDGKGHRDLPAGAQVVREMRLDADFEVV